MNDPFRVYKSFDCKSFGLVGTTFPKAFVKCIPTSTIYLIKKNSITVKQCLTNNLIFPQAPHFLIHYWATQTRDATF